MNQLNSSLLRSLGNNYKLKLHSSSILLAGLCSLTPAAYALSVVSQTPTVNALDQNADSNITIEFDDSMGNAITDNFIVNGSLSGLINGAFTTTGKNITFDPSNDLRAGGKLSIDHKSINFDGDHGHIISDLKLGVYAVHYHNYKNNIVLDFYAVPKTIQKTKLYNYETSYKFNAIIGARSTDPRDKNRLNKTIWLSCTLKYRI